MAHAVQHVTDAVIPQPSHECEYFQMSKSPPERAILSLTRLRPCDVASISVPKKQFLHNKVIESTHRRTRPRHWFACKSTAGGSDNAIIRCYLREKHVVACLPARTNVLEIAGGKCDHQLHAVLSYAEAYIQLCLCSRHCETAVKCSSRQCQLR